jgi:6-phosphogluconolactonase
MSYRAIFSSLVLALQASATPVFIGTTTGKDTASLGIYLADFNSATGVLSEPEFAAAYKNPGFLALHPTLPVLYTIGSPKKPFSDGSGSVAAYSIAKDHSLTFLDEANTGGNGPTHLTLDATGKTLAVANYGDGGVSTILLDDKGVPTGTVSLRFGAGAGPNKARQEGPHAHGVYFDQSNKYLFVPDLGLDQILIYPFNAGTASLGDPLPSLALEPGAGPRHMVISADQKFVYIINELANTVTCAQHVAGEGKLTTLSCITTLPADYVSDVGAAEIEIHPNGNFLYVSNRGHQSIAVFKRDPVAGGLTFLQHAACGGEHPRHFKIDPSGKWLLCANQNSNSISVLALDPETGLLGAPSQLISTPSPCCLLFGR